jgi:hypothetical protein
LPKFALFNSIANEKSCLIQLMLVWAFCELSFRQEALAKIARPHGTPYLGVVIKAIDASQGGPPIAGFIKPSVCPEPAASGEPAESIEGQAAVPVTPDDIPLLSAQEKRRILARIVRTNALDCFDDAGAFDIARAKRVLPPGSVRHIDVDETTRTDAEGQPVTQRHIRLRLVDPLSALRLDDILERRGQPTASSFRYPNPHPASREYSFNLLRDKTLALDEALQSIEDLKKSLAEAGDRNLQLSRQLEETHHPLGTPPPETPGSSPTSKVPTPGRPSQCGTGCQHVHPETPAERPETTAQPPASVSRKGESTGSLAPSLPDSNHVSPRDPGRPPSAPEDHHEPSQPEPVSAFEKDLASLKGKSIRLSFQAQRALETAQGQALRDLKKLQALCFQQEAEEVRNSSGPLAFAEWLRARGINPADYRPPPLPKKPPANGPRKSAPQQPPRPPPRTPP